MRFDFVRQTTQEGIGVRALSIARDGVVWASGTNGAFARTTDGGASWIWSRIPGYESFDFRSIKAFGDEIAVAMSAGRPATILKTVDGGASWKESFSDPSERFFLDAMAFWDDGRGFALGDPVDDALCLFETRDAGDGWSRVVGPGLPATADGEAHFAASGTCIAAFGDSGLCVVSGGAVSEAYVSGDRGATWRKSGLPLLRGEPSRGAFSASVHGDGKICVVGGDYARPEIAADTAAYSRDGGRSWRPASAFPPGGYNSCVAYVPGSGGTALVATGTRGSHVSSDGGDAWSALHPEPFHVLAFERSGSRGWAAGTDGRISMITVS